MVNALTDIFELWRWMSIPHRNNGYNRVILECLEDVLNNDDMILGWDFEFLMLKDITQWNDLYQ